MVSLSELMRWHVLVPVTDLVSTFIILIGWLRPLPQTQIFINVHSRSRSTKCFRLVAMQPLSLHLKPKFECSLPTNINTPDFRYLVTYTKGLVDFSNLNSSGHATPISEPISLPVSHTRYGSRSSGRWHSCPFISRPCRG